MLTLNQSQLTPFQDLVGLAEICKQAGAAAATVICSQEKVVVFYRDAPVIGVRHPDFFDELHIDPAGNACILIAVFSQEIG